MASPLRVVIAGGGTGGHLYPGIAVARELLARRPDAEVSFAGTARGIEARVVPREGFALDLIRSSGVKGKSLVDRARGAALVPLGLADGWRIVSARRPSLVIGVGGYSSGPVVVVAALRGVPTMLLEQNAVPGLTNRVLARFVQAAAVTFDSTQAFFGAKAFVSGNPVRPEFFAASGPHQESALDDQTSVTRVLVFGGSQGAHAINVAMVEAASQLAAGGSTLRLVHQTGERDVEMVRTAYRQAGLQADVEPFLYDMGRQLGQADVVVCRGGMTTLAEIMAAGEGRRGDSAADGDRRSPAQERRGAGGGGSRGAAAAARPDRTGARGARAGAGRRPRPARSDGGGGANAGAARRGTGHRRSRAGTGEPCWVRRGTSTSSASAASG